MKNQVNELIASRRSYFTNLFTGAKVDDSVIWQMLENANWAPTHKLTEPWRFVVFAGEGLKTFSKIQSGLYKEVATADGTYKEEKFKNLQEKPLVCSHVIAIGMKRDPQKRVREIEEIEAVACAVQNMYLTATAYEVGCYWGTGGITYMEEARQKFGLGEEDKLLGFLYVGIPRIKIAEGRRNPIEDKVSWITE